MKIHHLLIPIAFLLFTNCNSDTKQIHNVDSIFKIGSFKKNKKISGTKLDLGIVLSPIKLFHTDSLLLISSVGTNPLVNIYNQTQNYQKIGGMISYGLGPEEMTSVSEIQFINDSNFWAQDIQTSQMKRLILKITNDSVYTQNSGQVSLNGPSLEPFSIKNEKIISTTQEIVPFNRFYIYDIQNNTKKGFADYPSYDRKIPNSVAVEVFNAFATVHPDQNKFALAYEYTDLIELYNSEAELIKRIQGPHIFQPEFELKDRNGHFAMRRVYEKTKLAYIALDSNKDEIFLLYGNGDTRKKGEGEEGIHHNHIVTIDWEGNPLNYYELDHGVTTITVDFNKRIIYGLDRMESEVYAFEY